MKRVDRNMVVALQSGDHEAFEEIFAVFFGRVKAFIFGYIKSDVDAEELAQDIFVNLWTGRGSIDPARPLGAYLHTVARNSALNFLRHKLVRQTHAGSLAGDEGSAGSEEELIARETAMLIEMAVERMPAQRREIYRLSRGEGLKNDEIADRLGTTKRNVESQLSLALKEIRKIIVVLLLSF